jgi:PAS domain S-box-containing protein
VSPADLMLHGDYDLRLVTLSVVIAILASSVALDLAGRVTAARGRARGLWLAGGALAMGLGIWSMHYVGMLAFHLPVAVRYEVLTVLASLLAAVFASAVALFVVSREALGLTRLLTGSVVMGAGIAAMHYIGMAAMRMPAILGYHPVLWTLSVVIAIVVSLVALLLAFRFRADVKRLSDWRKLGSVLLMGAAIPAMHYTGMAAAHFTATPGAVDLGGAVSISSLGAVAIGGATFLVLALATGTSMLDRYLATQAGELARFATIVQSSHDAILATTVDGVIVAWNPGAERLWGYRANETRGRPLSILAPPERVANVAAFIARVVSGEHIDQYEAVGIRKDGTPVDVSVTYSPIRDRGGQVVGVTGIARDITERKRVEQAMREARDAAERAAQAKSSFLANMSHEIRTPMNGILGMTELLLDTDLSLEQRRQLQLVHGSADGLLAILNDVLDYSKIEAQHLDLESIAFDLGKLIQATVMLFATRAEAKQVELMTDVSLGVPARMRGDPTRLRQVLTNLIGNAIKFTHEGEVVLSVATVERKETEGRIRFAVRDTGIGIAAEQRLKIFEEFAQADVSMTRRYGGTGLGLAISHRLVGLMGGELTVSSEIGRGSEFSFTLTCPVDVWERERAVAPKGARPAGRRVLIVDDNETNRQILQEMLATDGMVVSDASGADRALVAMRRAVLEGAPFDLAVIDAQMPNRDGFDLAAAVQSDPSIAGTRLCMLTSAGQRGDAQRCRDLAIQGYLTKPISRIDLLEAVSLVLANVKPETVADVVTRHTIREARRELTILLAEDNPVNQEVASVMLRKRGHQVDVVANGREAVEAVRRAKYDVVLMDIQMPEMDGLAATAAIRELAGGADLPIFAVTAHAMGDERDRCFARGMNGYLTKPFKGHELYALVEGWTERRAPDPAPSRPAEPRAVSVVDLEGFRSTMRDAGAEEAVDGILRMFATSASERLEAIAAAVQARDATAVERAAHAFKSAAATIGARLLAERLREIELAGREGAVERAAGEMPGLHADVAAVLNHLKGDGQRAPPDR